LLIFLPNYSYDREPGLARLRKGLDDAAKYNWVIVDMRNDWRGFMLFINNLKYIKQDETRIIQ